MWTAIHTNTHTHTHTHTHNTNYTLIWVCVCVRTCPAAMNCLEGGFALGPSDFHAVWIRMCVLFTQARVSHRSADWTRCGASVSVKLSERAEEKPPTHVFLLSMCSIRAIYFYSVTGFILSGATCELERYWKNPITTLTLAGHLTSNWPISSIFLHFQKNINGLCDTPRHNEKIHKNTKEKTQGIY